MESAAVAGRAGAAPLARRSAGLASALRCLHTSWLFNLLFPHFPYPQLPSGSDPAQRGGPGAPPAAGALQRSLGFRFLLSLTFQKAPTMQRAPLGERRRQVPLAPAEHPQPYPQRAKARLQRLPPQTPIPGTLGRRRLRGALEPHSPRRRLLHVF